jgi:hypothetical protein
MVHVEQARCHGSNPARLQFFMYVVVCVEDVEEGFVGVAIVGVSAN